MILFMTMVTKTQTLKTHIDYQCFHTLYFPEYIINTNNNISVFLNFVYI